MAGMHVYRFQMQNLPAGEISRRHVAAGCWQHGVVYRSHVLKVGQDSGAFWLQMLKDCPRLLLMFLWGSRSAHRLETPSQEWLGNKERNFHIFYQMLAADAETRTAIGLGDTALSRNSLRYTSSPTAIKRPTSTPE